MPWRRDRGTIPQRQNGVCTMTEVQAAIAEFMDGQAAWRSSIAAEYPEDRRNAQASDALDRLADYIRGLPDDDERLVNIGHMAFMDGMFDPGPDASREIGRFGFNGPPPSADEVDQYVTELGSLVLTSLTQLAKDADVLE